MQFSSLLRCGAAGLALAAIACSAPAMAQVAGPIVQPGTPNADRLAAAMKTLATDPNNADALIAAGEANIRLDDPEAALQFFQRAEHVRGPSARIIAGRAAALVALEKPGEAMLLFRQAQAAGYPEAAMALDRGLAYDLLGYQRYAQRDYRMALTRGPDDETTRRLSLSLGISGDLEESEAVLLPLLQRNDRAAWRVRACVLAMNGRTQEADAIAASMLPGFGGTLAPFFARLGKLSPGDRAHAVNFGQLDPTPARVADAALVAPLPPLDDGRAVRLASARVDAPAPDTGRSDDRRSRNRRQRDDRRTVAAVAAPPPAPAPAPVQLPPPLVIRVARAAPPVFTPIPVPIVPVDLAPSAVASADAPPPDASGPPAPAPGFAGARDAPAPAPAPAPVVTSAAPPPVPAPAPVAGPPAPGDGDADRQKNVDALGAIVAGIAGDGPAAAPPPAPVVGDAGAGPAPDAVRSAAAPPAALISGAPLAGSSAAPPPVAVVAGPPAPAAGTPLAGPVSAPPGAAGAPVPSPSAISGPLVQGAPDASAPPPFGLSQPSPADGDDAFKPKPFVPGAPPAPLPGHAAAAPPVKDAPVDDAKAPPAKLTAKDAAKGAKDAAAKAPPKGKPAPPPPREPARVWVQVAGGADERSLPSTWAKLAKQAPAAFKGRSPWTVPVAATNRLLAGPFKDAREAQAFVNQIAGQGIKAFVWSSAAGQAITKLKAP